MNPSPYIYPGLVSLPYSLEGILETVCRATGTDRAEVCSKSRKTETVAARQLFCFFAKKHTKHTFGQIGKMLGSYDHSTVIHAIKKVNDMIYTKDPLITGMFDKIKKELTND